GGMEDVIFAGAATRPARNFAEVSLSLDNTARRAPPGLNEADLIEVNRRITRDAGSAYKANGKEMRARDIQMLFADASTGAHSPALVRQGQIAELINAKPKARRRILEEAAGISGLYQRRHEAELKLRATETNLERIEDVIEQLAGQLAQLARQAKQAARYREIGTELRRAEGMLLYRRWHEADAALTEARRLLTERSTLAARAEAEARQAVTARENANEALPPLREEDAIAGAVLQRLAVQREALDQDEARAQAQIRDLESKLAQVDKDVARESSLTSDADDTIRRLTEEQAALAASGEGHGDRLTEAEQSAEEAATVLDEREQDLARLTEDMARLSARHHSAERFLDDSRKALDRHSAEADKARAAATAAREAVASASDAKTRAEAALATAATAQTEAEAQLHDAEQARANLHGAEAEARARHSETQAEVKALSAEVAALTRLLDRDGARGAQLLDEVGVADGYERALGAALGDDLAAPRLGEAGGLGWAELDDYADAEGLPEGIEPLSKHVTAPPILARRLARIGVVSAEDGARHQADLRPGQRLVSVEGDLWRWDGYAAAAADAPTAAALRLEQMNRRAALESALVDAEAKAADAAEAHGTLGQELAEASQVEKAVREARRAADAALSDASRALSRAEADLQLAEGRAETSSHAVSRHEGEAATARESLSEAEARLAELPDLSLSRTAVDKVRMAVEAARLSMMARRAAFDELRRDGTAREKRATQVTRDLATWTERRDTAGTRIAELDARRAATQADLGAAKAAPETLIAQREELSRAIAEAEARSTAAQDAVAAAEAAFRRAADAEREAERAASDMRETRAATEARVQAAVEAVETCAARITEETGDAPQKLLESLDIDPAQIPPADETETLVARLRRQRDALGAVNLRAEEDAAEVREEHGGLVAEREDLESAVSKLRSGIAGLNREGRERLLTAFEEVNGNFSQLFTHLFGGGEARLMLVESDDPLEAGLEIMCQPPGKKLSTLSLLSGGEQTLTAMALIFAVFLANPAPICVLDEVDAPLDDANVTRFCDLLDEMTRRTQTRFLIITHHAVTMARMDRLFGVTMAEQGVSQLVSVDLKKAEAMVA
ncbi:MAG: chromosome segregation protein SMC, partial [Pseudomonadota bacterium]